MEAILHWIKPELCVLVLVCYLTGLMLKKVPSVKDWTIPFVLTGLAVLLAACYVGGTSRCGSGGELFLALFTAAVQGILCAGLAVYGNQLKKQIRKRKQ